ncbi:MAG: hypothetical protein H7844_07575 [Nitrospirae bacterium YQR-1]
MEEKTKYEFDPTHYNHLTEDTTLDCWIAEFLARNKAFQADYDKYLDSAKKQYHNYLIFQAKFKELNELHNESSIPSTEWYKEFREATESSSDAACEFKNILDSIYNRYGVIISNIYKTLPNNIRLVKIQLPNRVLAYRVFDKATTTEMLKEFFERVPQKLSKKPGEAFYDIDHNVNQKSNEVENINPLLIFKHLFPQCFYNMRGEKLLATLGMIDFKSMQMGDSFTDGEKLLKEEDEILKPEREFSPTGNHLVLKIDLTLPRKDIERQIKQHLDINLFINKDSRKHIKKWKYYLIVFDLKKNGKSYSKISTLLMKAYSKDKNVVKLLDEKNIEHYYKEALELIESGYKEYI